MRLLRRGRRSALSLVASPPVSNDDGSKDILLTIRNVGKSRRDDYVTLSAHDGREWLPSRNGWQMPSDPGQTRQAWFTVDATADLTMYRVGFSDQEVLLEVP